MLVDTVNGAKLFSEKYEIKLIILGTGTRILLMVQLPKIVILLHRGLVYMLCIFCQ